MSFMDELKNAWALAEVQRAAGESFDILWYRLAVNPGEALTGDEFHPGLGSATERFLNVEGPSTSTLTGQQRISMARRLTTAREAMERVENREPTSRADRPFSMYRSGFTGLARKFPEVENTNLDNVPEDINRNRMTLVPFMDVDDIDTDEDRLKWNRDIGNEVKKLSIGIRYTWKSSTTYNAQLITEPHLMFYLVAEVQASPLVPVSTIFTPIVMSRNPAYHAVGMASVASWTGREELSPDTVLLELVNQQLDWLWDRLWREIFPTPSATTDWFYNSSRGVENMLMEADEVLHEIRNNGLPGYVNQHVFRNLIEVYTKWLMYLMLSGQEALQSDPDHGIFSMGRSRWNGWVHALENMEALNLQATLFQHVGSWSPYHPRILLRFMPHANVVDMPRYRWARRQDLEWEGLVAVHNLSSMEWSLLLLEQEDTVDIQQHFVPVIGGYSMVFGQYEDENIGFCSDCGPSYPYWREDLRWSEYTEDWYCLDDFVDEEEEPDEEPLSVAILNYSYKPAPAFKGKSKRRITGSGDALYMGMELEVCAKGSRTTAAKWMQEEFVQLGVNTSWNEGFVYFKQDVSVNNGFEIVTHPFTPEWGLEHFPFKVFEKALQAEVLLPSHLSAGQHIHVNKNAFSKAHMFKFLVLHEKLDTFIGQVGGRPSVDYANFPQYKRWAETPGAKMKWLTENVWEHGPGRAAVNLDNTHTIELRYPAGDVRPDNIRKNIEWIDCIYEFSRLLTVKDIKEMNDPGFLIFFLQAKKAQYPTLAKLVDSLIPQVRPSAQMEVI